MELLCIETLYWDGVYAVLAGQTYPLLREGSPCKCDTVDVGISSAYDHPLVDCVSCNTIHWNDGTWWILRSRFIPIGTQDELENYKLSEPALK